MPDIGFERKYPQLSADLRRLWNDVVGGDDEALDGMKTILCEVVEPGNGGLIDRVMLMVDALRVANPDEDPSALFAQLSNLPITHDRQHATLRR